MDYKRFAMFDVIGGVLWPTSMVMIGYVSAHLVPNLDKKMHIVVPVVIFVSILPGIIEAIREKRREKRVATAEAGARREQSPS